VAHATVGILVLGVVGRQQRSIILPCAVAVDTVFVGDTVLLLIVRDRGLGEDNE
jgi:hypothetical protein